MLTIQEFNFLRDKIYSMFSFNADIEFELLDTQDVYISVNGTHATISATVKTNTLRALSIMIKHMKDGDTNFTVREHKHFQTLGFMLDVSRNAVMRVGKIKEMIDTIASCGFDSFMLYMEDTFELPGYPYFGYRRGRYSLQDLQEIDDYAYSLGVEVVPSIQTLGHLEQYLRYSEAQDICENQRVLLCGEEKTYIFIEDVLKHIRKAFRSHKINIGCDEADGVGLGNYLKTHEYRPRYEIICEHLNRVCQLCHKYDFRPLVCGDLYIPYYDLDYQIPPETIRDVPDVDILYWDYYHTEKKHFQQLLNMHKALGRNVTFYGGIWTWCGMLPNPAHTHQTMDAALSVMLENSVNEVWAATYGDDGNETNMLFSLPSLAVFSEKCFKGIDCTYEDIAQMSRHVTGIPYEAFLSLSENHFPFIDFLERSDYIFPNYMGKKLFYTDVLYNFANTYRLEEVREHNARGLDAIAHIGIGTKWEPYFEYARLIFQAVLIKIDLLTDIRTGYSSKNTALLGEISNSQIPLLIEVYQKLRQVYEELWIGVNRVFGWEEIDIRLSGIIARLEYTQRAINRYITGESSAIEEMEYPFMEDFHGTALINKGLAGWYRNLKSTGL